MSNIEILNRLSAGNKSNWVEKAKWRIKHKKELDAEAERIIKQRFK